MGADEILPRLVEIYDVKVNGWDGDGGYDWYFVVRRSQPLESARAMELVRPD